MTAGICRRFWVSRGGLISLADGYLADPADPHTEALNPDVVEFEAIARRRFMALLGEPGIGKTTALGEIAKAARAHGAVVYRDLATYSSDVLLQQDVFKSSELNEAIATSDGAVLILDSLDECRIHVRTVAALLAQEFRRLPPNRVQVRIACRTADWPEGLGKACRDIWGGEEYAEYELAPLRRVDVRQLAEGEGVDPDAFLTAVRSRGLQPLAIRPLTLGSLLKAFKEGRDLPADPVDVYLAACAAMCRESNVGRHDAGAVGELTENQRLRLAEQIAATCMFCGKAAIFHGANEGERTPEDVTVSELIWESIDGDHGTVQVTSDHVREVLGTGLFSGRSGTRMGWAHATFAEFLAARFVVTRNLARPQIISVFMRADSDRRDRVIPQLRETAAWLAALDGEFRAQVAGSDPEVLLRPSAAGIDSRVRATVVARLLELADVGKALDRDLDLRSRYGQLAHEDLSSQLRPYIEGRTRNRVVRRMAIDIAEACGAGDLLPVLGERALDSTEDQHIRSQAAHAVLALGDAADKVKLRALLACPPAEDDDDELKGVALLALWPELLSAEDLFQEHLTPPRRPNFYGAYALFIRRLETTLRPEDHIPALEWVAQQPPDHNQATLFWELPAAIMQAAWPRLGEEAVLSAFARAAEARLRHFDPVLSEGSGRGKDLPAALMENSDSRRRLLAALVRGPAAKAGDRTFLFRMRELLLPDDFGWVLQQCVREADDAVARTWVEIASRTLDMRRVDHTEAVLTLRGEERIGAAFRELLEPVTLGSAEAATMRARDAAAQELWNPPPRPPVTHPPLPILVKSWLDRFEGGVLDAWWRLNLDITLPEDSDSYPSGAELRADLTAWPAWELLDEPTRLRCIEAALRYLREAEPEDEKWLGTNILHRRATAGYRALRLLQKARPAALQALDAVTWQKWAAIVLAFPESMGAGDDGPMLALVAMAYGGAPSRVLEVLDRLMTQEDRQGTVFVVRKLEQVRDGVLVAALAAKVRSGEVSGHSTGILLQEVLARDRAVGAAAALEIVESWHATGGDAARAQFAMVALLDASPADAWPVLSRLMAEAGEFAFIVLQTLAADLAPAGRPRLTQELGEEALRDLYLFLHQHEPGERSLGMGHVPPRESLVDLRDVILGALKVRGTPEAVQAVSRLAEMVPEKPWLRYTVLEAEEERLRHSWQGLSIATIRALSESRSARAIETELHLQLVVLESLGRLQARLKGETPAVRNLWNEDRERGPSPKDETHLSDYIKRHLESDLLAAGVVVNREVQISRTEVTDIRVEAFRRDAGDLTRRLGVTLEVKGCWNPGLKTDMEGQLRDRYLARGTTAGIYVVGWFRGGAWDPTDYREGKTSKWHVDDARAYFGTQAKSLSGAGLSVMSFVLDAAFE